MNEAELNEWHRHTGLVANTYTELAAALDPVDAHLGARVRRLRDLHLVTRADLLRFIEQTEQTVELAALARAEREGM